MLQVVVGGCFVGGWFFFCGVGGENGHGLVDRGMWEGDGANTLDQSARSEGGAGRKSTVGKNFEESASKVPARPERGANPEGVMRLVPSARTCETCLIKWRGLWGSPGGQVGEWDTAHLGGGDVGGVRASLGVLASDGDLMKPCEQGGNCRRAIMKSNKLPKIKPKGRKSCY